MAALTERQEESRCDELIEKLGGDVVRFSQARATHQTYGIPDRRYRVYGVAFWWEVKLPGAQYYEDQYAFACAEYRAGQIIGVGGFDQLVHLVTLIRTKDSPAVAIRGLVLDRSELGLKQRQPNRKRAAVDLHQDYTRAALADPARFPNAAAHLKSAKEPQ